MSAYGYELIIDVHGADARLFNRAVLLKFFGEMCCQLHLNPEKLHWWDYDDPLEKAAAPRHLKGTSAIQFIETSSLVVHTLDDLGQVFINLFTCGEFGINTTELAHWCRDFFSGDRCNIHLVERGEMT